MPDEVELSGGDAAPVVLGEAWPRWWRWTSSVEVAAGELGGGGGVGGGTPGGGGGGGGGRASRMGRPR